MDYPRSYGPYTLLERLGRGGMSDVDLARQSVDSASYVRFVVIKRLRSEMTANPAYIRMFQDEARINAELQHANIAQVYSFGQTNGEYFLAMEYIAGADLREVQKALVRGGRRVPTRIALRIIVDVLSALSYAHSRVDTYGRQMRIVHRDVNPRNIMLSGRGEVKLIDFGVAKAANRAEQTIRHTFKGKFAYMAPEQIQEDVTVDQRADLYAMGLVLHELINGSSPFAGLGDIQIMQRILTGRIPALINPMDFDQTELLRAVHEKALKLDPSERFQSADEMLAAVQEAAEGAGGVARTDELIAFLSEVLPDAVAQRQEQLEAWREKPEASTFVTPSIPTEDVTISVVMKPRQAIPPILMGIGLGLGILALGALLFARWSDSQSPLEPQRFEVAPETIVITPEPIDFAPESLQEIDPVESAETPTEITPIRKVRPRGIEVTSPSEEPSVEPEVQGTGRISVPSFPGSGLDVLMDGRKIGQTPIRLLEVAAGSHTIEVIDPGGEGWVSTVEVSDGASEYVPPPR